MANQFFTVPIEAGSLDPFTAEEVKAYYRENAWIWRSYLVARKIDRSLHTAMKMSYPHILPEKIKR